MQLRTTYSHYVIAYALHYTVLQYNAHYIQQQFPATSSGDQLQVMRLPNVLYTNVDFQCGKLATFVSRTTLTKLAVVDVPWRNFSSRESWIEFQKKIPAYCGLIPEFYSSSNDM